VGEPVSSDDDRKSRSIPENKSGFTVAASPLNPVKLELGIVLILGFVLFLVVSYLVESPLAQFGILIAYGLLSMLWIIYRVKSLITALEKE